MQHKIWIAICEDDETERDYIRSLVTAWSEKTGRECRIDVYVSAEQLLFSFEEELPYSIYILDIQMGKLNGMELAKKIRERDQAAKILFLTGLRDYALEGYEVGAMRYLIKPVREQELSSVLTRAAEECETTEETYFIWEQGGEVHKIPYSDIWYLESKGHYLDLVFREKGIPCRVVRWKASLGSVQAELEQNGFVLVRRGILVNLRRITRVGRTECVLDNGESLMISRNQYKKVNEAFIAYYRNSM